MMRYLYLLKVESWGDLRQKYCYTSDNLQVPENVKVVLSNQFETPYLMGLQQPYLVLPNKQYDADVFKYIGILQTTRDVILVKRKHLQRDSSINISTQH